MQLFRSNQADSIRLQISWSVNDMSVHHGYSNVQGARAHPEFEIKTAEGTKDLLNKTFLHLKFHTQNFNTNTDNMYAIIPIKKSVDKHQRYYQLKFTHS